jgi:AcrR family transcriptional regulator
MLEMNDMNKENAVAPRNRPSLTKERIVSIALKLADEGGLEALSMRKLGQELGVEAMALYHHFASKNLLIESMIDRVHAEIEMPLNAEHWTIVARERAKSVLEVLSRHTWAPSFMESGVNPGPATMQDRESFLKCFREAGFSIELTVHAVSVLDIYTYGFAQQLANLSFETAEQAAEVGKAVMEQFPFDTYPYMGEMVTQHMMKAGYRAMDEFDFGLDLIIDGIARVEPSKD